VNRQLDLNQCKGLREKLRTRAGQVRQAWPELRDRLADGRCLKDVWARLNEIGLEIGYARLSDYVGQLRRQDEARIEGMRLHIACGGGDGFTGEDDGGGRLWNMHFPRRGRPRRIALCRRMPADGLC